MRQITIHAPTESQRQLVATILEDIASAQTHVRVDIGRRAHVAESTLANWANGKTKNPRLDTICRVAEVLGYRVTLEKTHAPSADRPATEA